MVAAVQTIGQLDWRGDPARLRAWPDGPRSGDEPHYSIILHSVLYDGDLDLGDDYASAAEGGYESGRFWKGRRLDPHTLMVDPVTGRHVLWHDVWEFQDRQPCDTPGCFPYRMKRPHGFEDLGRVVHRPAHPPASALVVAALLAPFSLEPRQVDAAGATLLRAGASLTLIATAATAWMLGAGPGLALLAAALLGLATPWLAYTGSLYSEGLSSTVLAFGLLALVCAVPWLAAVFAVAAFWMKPALVVVGAAWILERWWAGDRRAAGQITAVMAVGGFALLAFNHFVLGRVWISGTYAWQPPDGLRTFFDTMLHERYGALTFVPWLVLAVPGMWRGPAPGAAGSARQIGLPCALHWVLLGTYGAMGATCYGPRYWIPFMPFFAVAAALALAGAGRAFRAGFAVLALAGLLLSVPGALLHKKAWDERPYFGLLRIASDLRARPAAD